MTYGMSLQVLLEGLLGECPNIAIGGLSQDSRAIKPGDAFVALQGDAAHGMDFAAQAVANGCVVIISDRPVEADALGVPVVFVPGLRVHIGAIAAKFWAAPSDLMTIAGVTGTNGKTSVAHFIAQAWQRQYGSAGLIGTLGYGPLNALQPAERTTPDVFSINEILASCLDAGIERVAMEVSSHALEQGRCQTVQFDAAVFTNLSRDHLDYHADMAAYAASKKRLFTDFAPKFAIINRDDPVGCDWIDELTGRMQVLGYGMEPGAELHAEILALDADGMSLRLNGPWGMSELRTALLGTFNVSNLLATAGALALLGMDWEAVVRELEMIRPVPGRMMRLGGGVGQPVVVVDYAHTPDALSQALNAVRAHLSGRLVCVFGCGGNRDRGKRAEMGRAVEALADQVFVTSDNPRYESVTSIINDVLAGLENPGLAQVEPDRAAAITNAIQGAGPGDIVLVAGKGHETWQEIEGRRIPFSDEATVRGALEEAA